MTDTLLKAEAMDILVKNLGVVNTERFVTLILREPFDYTEWRRNNLSEDITLEELNEQAINYWNDLQSKPV